MLQPQFIHTATGVQYIVTASVVMEHNQELHAVYHSANGIPWCRPLTAFREKFHPVAAIDQAQLMSMMDSVMAMAQGVKLK